MPTDKEILKEPANVRTWLVQDALCRTLVEVMDLLEAQAKSLDFSRQPSFKDVAKKK